MVVVVEGKNDVNKLKSIFPDFEYIITNGSEISKSTLELIKKSSQHDEVIICVDPDVPGEKIRKVIEQAIPSASHVFANKVDAISKNHKKIGIEHMNKENIIELFKNVKKTKRNNNITYLDLYKLGYMDSKEKRMKACKKYNISYCNAKQFLKRINMFDIPLEELERI